MKNLRTKLRYTIYTLLVAFLMVSCDGAYNDVRPEENYKIIEIDGCEYIFISRRPFASDMAITHKGDCKNHKYCY